VLAFWRAVELFSPQKVPKLSQDHVYKLEAGSLLPWQDEHALKKERIRRSNVWQHSVFLGIFSLDDAYADLRKALKDQREDDNGDPPRAGRGALAAFTVAKDGRVILGSQTLSSCAWALSRAFADRAGARGWVGGFEHAANSFAEEFNELLALSEDDEQGAKIAQKGHPVGPVLDFALLESLREHVAELLATESSGAGRAVEEASEIRVRSYQVGKTSCYRAGERDFLNSFIARDLKRVANAVGNGGRAYGPALGCYLSSAEDGKAEAKTLGRVDVEQDLPRVRELLAPEHVPLGRWPRSVTQPADLGQQLAVNAVVHGELSRDGPGGLLAVNGPPGTGKTTMLRDLIAAFVVERAQRLAELHKPEDAFEEKPITFSVDSQKRTVHRLKPKFTGYEMVLACATNAAAENVSAEIPLAEAIAPEWREHGDYFADIATSMLGGSSTNSEEEEEEEEEEEDGDGEEDHDDDDPREAWAMVAACLGTVARCKTFATAFWFGRDTNDGATNSDSVEGVSAATDAELGLRRILQNHQATPGDWNNARKDFGAVLKRVEGARAERQKDVQLFTELEVSQRGLQERISQLPETQAILQNAKHRLASQQRDLTRCKDEHKRALEARERHQAARPRLPKVLRTLGRALRQWSAHDDELAKHITATERKRTEAITCRENADREVTSATKRVKRNEAEQRNAHKRIERSTREITDSRERRGTTSPGSVFPDQEWIDPLQRARRELRAPWIDQDWDTARTELFLAALDLHKAFALSAAAKLKPSLSVAIDVVQDSSPSEVPPHAALAAWQCLFLLVPVVSTTFASYPRLFRHLGQEALGFLFIDEAGQSTPQNAAGPIWRSRNALVVGDPRQLEPIVTLPLRTQEDLRDAHAVKDALLPSHCSAQTLADRVTRIGTYRGGESKLWVGSPLTVHRRCDEPMFTIVNQIAYDNQMIAQIPHRDELALPDSAWLHVTEGHSYGHWMPEEGKRLQRLLDELERHSEDFKELFLIAPFRDVADKLRDYRASHPRTTAGTIHTTQGKEADVVILVLGGRSHGDKDKRWASQKPNLLNVAVSRAKRRIYVIGDRNTWAKRPYFSTLATPPAGLGEDTSPAASTSR
jgi:hypothetical protein